MQLARRPPDPALIRDGHEVAQLTKVHSSPPSPRLSIAEFISVRNPNFTSQAHPRASCAPRAGPQAAGRAEEALGATAAARATPYRVRARSGLVAPRIVRRARSRQWGVALGAADRELRRVAVEARHLRVHCFLVRNAVAPADVRLCPLSTNPPAVRAVLGVQPWPGSSGVGGGGRCR
jgi:hypothetical protein